MIWIRNKIRKYADKITNHRSSCYSEIASFSDANSVNVQIWISSEYKFFLNKTNTTFILISKSVRNQAKLSQIASIRINGKIGRVKLDAILLFQGGNGVVPFCTENDKYKQKMYIAWFWTPSFYDFALTSTPVMVSKSSARVTGRSPSNITVSPRYTWPSDVSPKHIRHLSCPSPLTM